MPQERNPPVMVEHFTKSKVCFSGFHCSWHGLFLLSRIIARPCRRLSHANKHGFGGVLFALASELLLLHVAGADRATVFLLLCRALIKEVPTSFTSFEAAWH
jgi:hypothetical protein